MLAMTALLIVGWAPPSRADDLSGKSFFVILLHNTTGTMVDYGSFYFWEEESGYKWVNYAWQCGGGAGTAERDDDENEGSGDFGPYGSTWNAWHPAGCYDRRYFEYDWFYCKRWDTLIGHAYFYSADGSTQKYTLNGWYAPFGTPW
jgi:hypothetical protein